MNPLYAAALFLATASSAELPSLLHLTAHPDDEHGGTLTLLSRGQGVRGVLPRRGPSR